MVNKHVQLAIHLSFFFESPLVKQVINAGYILVFAMRLILNSYSVLVLFFYAQCCLSTAPATVLVETTARESPTSATQNGPLMPSNRNYGLFDRPIPPPILPDMGLQPGAQ
jgi:hypothetical protein